MPQTPSADRQHADGIVFFIENVMTFNPVTVTESSEHLSVGNSFHTGGKLKPACNYCV